MRTLSPTSADLRFALLWAAAGILEAPALALMAGRPLPIPAWLGVLAHAGAAALVFLAPPREKGWFKATRHWGQPLGILTLLMPGMGWALAGWLVLRHAEAPQAKEAYRFEDVSADDVNPLAGFGTPEAIRRELADALDVIPAVDALLSRAPQLKRGAIETLSRIRTASAISWIFRARADVDPEVRFYATTALTRLKRDFETAISAAEKESYRRPGELAAQISLQRIRYEYAATDMLEPLGRQALLGDCRAKLTPLSERSPDATRLLYLVERSLEPARALPLLDRLEAADPERARLWTRERVELLYGLGRYPEVRRLLRERGGELAGPEETSGEGYEWRSAALWWTDA